MRSLLSFFFLFLASVASADTIVFDPSNVTTHHAVDATVKGTWSDSCIASASNVVVAGSTITLHLDANLPPNVGCLAVLSPYTRTFHLDVVPAGSYTVIAVVDRGNTSTERARATLTVRDAETFTLVPYAVPTTGGTISLGNPFFPASATLTIGGVTVPTNSNPNASLSADAPPHAPGAVDITVNSAAGTVTSKAALIYYDPASADPAVFEPILFPVSFQGPGALGSQWLTESFIYAGGSQALFRDPLPCTTCGRSLTLGSKQLINTGDPWGHVLYAMRGTTGTLDFASRIRDTSRQALTAGTEVPVVRERDFRGVLRFLNVPTDARYRVMLRLWSLEDFPQFVVFVSSPPVIGQQTLTVTKIPLASMWFGSMDVTPLLATSNGTPTQMTISGFNGSLPSPAIWGMLSITNNDTQQVTIISPQ
jgi:hypothetical protein